jgi:hypothetical protein
MTSSDSAVKNFREYLRIKTVQPNPDYGMFGFCEICYWLLHYGIILNSYEIAQLDFEYKL